MVEKYFKLVDAETADFTSSSVKLGDLVPRQGGSSRSADNCVSFGGSGTRDAYINFDTSGGATLCVEASLGHGSNFQEIQTISEAGVIQITGYPRMRLKLKNVASGTHSAGIYGDIVRDGRFIDMLTDLELLQCLKLSLDAGDDGSYTTGQSWLDLSGNGQDFFRGFDASVSSDDPTFSGSAGGLSSSEYFSFGGSEFFRYDIANEAWMEDLHKNNAAATFVFWVYVGSLSAASGLCGTTGGGTGTPAGFRVRVTPSGALELAVVNGAGGAALVNTSTICVSPGKWHCIALSVNEAAGSGGSFWFVDGAVEMFDGTYTSPSAGAADNRLELGSTSPGPVAAPEPLVSGSRLAGVAAYSTALSAQNVADFFNVSRGRFGV